MHNGKKRLTVQVYPQTSILNSPSLSQIQRTSTLHARNRKIFGISIFIIELIIIGIYSIFLIPKIHSNAQQTINYFFYQEINVMILIGFLLLRVGIKNHSLSAMSYVLFINALIIQIYFLWQAFWRYVLNNGLINRIQITQKSLISAEYAITTIVISFGSVLGRVGPLQLLIMALIEVIGYSFNQYILINLIKTFDAGGSITIHTFGAFFGLTISIQLSRYLTPNTNTKRHPYANIMSMIGTLFLFIYWPSFNTSFYSTNQYEQTLIITNTIIALAGSCMSTFAITALIKPKFQIQDILNATIAGGVIISASCNLFTNIVAALCIGLFAGILTTLGLTYLKGKLQSCLKLYDVCGVFMLHGLPGIFGGIFSAIAIAAYSSVPIIDVTQRSYLPFYNLCQTQRTFYQQGGIQIAAIFISMFSGIIFGLFTGCLMKIGYGFKSSQQFYNDQIYFEIQQYDDDIIDGYRTRAASGLGSFQDISMGKMVITEE